MDYNDLVKRLYAHCNTDKSDQITNEAASAIEQLLAEQREIMHATTGPLHKKLAEWMDADADGRLLVLEKTDDPMDLDGLSLFLCNRADAMGELNEYDQMLLREAGFRLAQIADMAQKGRLVKLPFVAMVEQSLSDGKMTPERDQRFNGRYAVVYNDQKKWRTPLIDICGKYYDRAEAEARMAALEGGPG